MNGDFPLGYLELCGPLTFSRIPAQTMFSDGFLRKQCKWHILLYNVFKFGLKEIMCREKPQFICS